MAKLLIVEDHEDLRQVLEDALSRDGHEVEAVADADTARERCHRRPPDLLVIDGMLAGRSDGADLARELHALRPELRTILISGYPNLLQVIDRDSDAVCTVLRKPFSLVVLREAVRKGVAPVS